MSDIQTRLRIEKIILDYLRSVDASIEDGVIEVLDYWPFEGQEISTTSIATDRLAEAIAEELAK